MTTFVTIRTLQELIVALDRRAPNRLREGEGRINREAAGLRAAALERIASLRMVSCVDKGSAAS